MASATLSGGRVGFELTLSLVSQNVAANQSTVRRRGRLWRISGGVYGAGGSYSASGAGGSKSGSFSYDFSGPHEIILFDDTFTVGHGPDGQSWISASATSNLNNPSFPGGATITQDLTLPTIPRTTIASFQGGSTFDAGTTVTINLPRASSSFTHDITYTFGSQSGTVATGAGTSATWTPPLTLLNEIPDATSGSRSIRVVTKNGADVVGYVDVGFTLRAGPAVVPTISSVSGVDDNPTVASIVGAYVQNLSVLKATVTAAGAYGSTITGRTFSVGSLTAESGGVIPLTASGSVAVTARAVDSRGRVGGWSGSITVLPYSQPTVTSCVVRRATSGGVVSDNGTYLRLDLNGAVASLKPGASEKNQMTVRVFTRQKGASSWTARNVITPGLTYNTNVLISGGGVYDIDKSWEVRVEVADKFITAVVQTLVATSQVLLHWSTGVGVMKFWENGALDVGGDIYQNGNLVVDTARTATTSRTGIAELATQAEVNTGTDTTRIVTPSTMKGATWLPTATAAGAVTQSSVPDSSYVDTTVTFPSGRFSAAPTVVVGQWDSGGLNVFVSAYGVTATGFTLRRRIVGASQNVGASWVAVQI